VKFEVLAAGGVISAGAGAFYWTKYRRSADAIEARGLANSLNLFG
jgi:hypothetical protein